MISRTSDFGHPLTVDAIPDNQYPWVGPGISTVGTGTATVGAPSFHDELERTAAAATAVQTPGPLPLAWPAPITVPAVRPPDASPYVAMDQAPCDDTVSSANGNASRVIPTAEEPREVPSRAWMPGGTATPVAPRRPAAGPMLLGQLRYQFSIADLSGVFGLLKDGGSSPAS